MMLVTLAAGLIWCQPTDRSKPQDISPVGTWISADAWEHGRSAGDTVVRFDDNGVMHVSVNGYTALYRYEDDILYLLAMDGIDGYTASDDTVSSANSEQYRCIIAGDHMAFYGHIAGMMVHHGRTDLIRISPDSELTDEELSQLY